LLAAGLGVEELHAGKVAAAVAARLHRRGKKARRRRAEFAANSIIFSLRKILRE
jgi:hypothetical protein